MYGITLLPDAVDINLVFPLAHPFTKEEDIIEIGQRVTVPFGPRFIMGYVLGIKSTSDFDRLRKIKDIMDIVPSLTPELIALGKELSISNTSPLVSIYQAMFVINGDTGCI